MEKDLVKVNSANLRSIKVNKGLISKDLADKAGIPRVYLAQIMCEHRVNVSRSTVQKLAELLEVRLTTLINNNPLPKEFTPVPAGKTAYLNSEILRAYRAKHRLTRRMLAEKSGVSLTALAGCENEDKACCTWSNLFKISKVFEIPPTTLLRDADWPEGLEPSVKELVIIKSPMKHNYKRPLLPIGNLFVGKGFHLIALQTQLSLGRCTVRDLFLGIKLPGDKLLQKVCKLTKLEIGEIKYEFSVSSKIRNIYKASYPAPRNNSRGNSHLTSKTKK